MTENLKTLPHNKDAELSVLGACFMSTEAFARAVETLRFADFYYQNNQLIFQAMLDLFAATEQIDVLTVADKLKSNGTLEKIGGLDALVLIQDYVPTSQAVSGHAKIVREKKVLRDLFAASEIIRESVFSERRDPAEVLDVAEKTIFEISQGKNTGGFQPLSDVVMQGYKEIEGLAEKPGFVTGVPTGFRDLDALTAGLQPSDLFILAARPSMGKTALALEIAKYAAMNANTPVAIFSMEMSAKQLGLRLLCQQAKVNLANMRTGWMGKGDWPKLAKGLELLMKTPVDIDDSAALTVMELRARARRLKTQNDIGLVIVDYLQLMSASVGGGENRQQEVTEISRGLKALAKELNVPVLALSQLNRACENRVDKRPLLSDLRESGAIEQDADVVAFIYRDQVYNDASEDAGIAEILIRKQRNGPTGNVRLAFQEEFTRFENLATEATE